LAQAIADHARATARLERVKEARSRLDLYGPDSPTRVKDRAERDLAAARARAPQTIVSRLLGTQTEGGLSVEDAEQALAAATRAADEATEARRLLDEEAAAAERAVEFEFYRRRAALTEVVRTSPQIVELADRIQQARQALHDFTWVCRAIGLQRLPYGAWDGVLRGSDTGQGDAWKAALAALEADADADLP
jgi:hypothetical protein